MHPGIAAQAMYDNHLYAIPTGINFLYYQINRETWESMGYTLADVPQSFPEFLDFLSAWCDRTEDNPEGHVAVLGGWDGETYSSASYTAWLTELLVSEATMQKQYAGEALTFTSPDMVSLFSRCAAIGERIFRLESRSYSAALFEQMCSSTWPGAYSQIVFLRLDDTQPKLIRAAAYMWAINAASKDPDKSLELLEKAALAINNPEAADDIFLYRDAQARVSPNYETDLAYWTEKMSETSALLQSDSLGAAARESLEEELNTYAACVQRTEDNKWLVTPEQLLDYQSASDLLYFPPLNIFDKSAEGYNKPQDLYNQFGHKRLTAEQMLAQLDRIADMMRLESQ